MNHPMPASDIRWKGLSMALHKSRDNSANARKVKSRKNKNDGSSAGSNTLSIVVFALGGLLVTLLMVAFFIYAW